MSTDVLSLKGKVAIVTGAGRGIGKAISLAFAEAGADIVAVSRTREEIEKTCCEVKALSREALAVTADVTSAEQVKRMVASWMLSVTGNRYLLLLLVNLFLFIVGMFMDDVSGMIICAPLLLPVIKEIGISPVHFAAIVTTNLTMGNLTPPMAPLVFLGQIIGKTTFPDMVKTSLLFVFCAWVPAVLITTYFAPIAEWLPVTVLGSKVLIPAY